MLASFFKADLLLLMDGKIFDSLCGSCFDFLYDSQLEILRGSKLLDLPCSFATLDVMLFKRLQMRDIVLVALRLFG
jgi:hypothetical protein